MSSDKIKLLKEQGKTIYPQTLSDAVLIDDESDKTLLEHIEENFVTKEEFDDNSIVMGKVEDTLVEFKEDVLKALENVADQDHSHNQYASKDHTHDEYLTKLPSHFHKYNNIIFPNDVLDNEKLKTEVERRVTIDYFNEKMDLTNEKLNKNTELLNKSIENHNHHDRYSQLDHKHDTIYSPMNHNHDNLYMPINKNFDDRYAKMNHNHDYRTLINTPHIPTAEELKKEINLNRYDELIDNVNSDIVNLTNSVNNNDILINNLKNEVSGKSDEDHTHDEFESLNTQLSNCNSLINTKYSTLESEINTVNTTLSTKLDAHTHNLGDIKEVQERIDKGDNIAFLSDLDTKVLNTLGSIDDRVVELVFQLLGIDINDYYEKEEHERIKIKNEIDKLILSTGNNLKAIETIQDFNSSLEKSINAIKEKLQDSEGNLIDVATANHEHIHEDLPQDIVYINVLDEYLESYKDEISNNTNEAISDSISNALLNYSPNDHEHESINDDINNLNTRISDINKKLDTHEIDTEKRFSDIEINISDNLSTKEDVNKKIELIIPNFATIDHEHDNYAKEDHEHDNYLTEDDIYSKEVIDQKIVDLATEINIGDYYNKNEVENLVSNLPVSEHNHDEFESLENLINSINKDLDNYVKEPDVSDMVDNKINSTLSNKASKEDLKSITDRVSSIEINYLDIKNTVQMKEDKNHKHDEFYTRDEVNKDFSKVDHKHDEYSENGHKHDEYSENGHKHDEYSEIGHKHDEYLLSADIDLESFSKVDHIHEEYALKNEVADITHNHDDLYAIKEDLEQKANSDHTHEEYAKLDHTHEEYASLNYIENNFSPITHNHTNYASLEHTHEDLYFTKEELESKYIKKEELESKLIHTHEEYATLSDVADRAKAVHEHEGQYSKIDHRHDNYAPSDHLHDNYALLEHTHEDFNKLEEEIKQHTHEDYALKSEVALIEHLHDDNYSKIDHIHENYMPIDHNFDDRYPLIDHEHDNYASLEHVHAEYALASEVSKITHNHDDRYSLALHNHDKEYSKLNHSHDDNYYNKEYVDTFFYTKKETDNKIEIHNHDNDYYKKSETLSTAETELKILNASLGFSKEAIQEIINESKNGCCGEDCDCGCGNGGEENKDNGIVFEGVISNLIKPENALITFTPSLFPGSSFDENSKTLSIPVNGECTLEENNKCLISFKENNFEVGGLLLNKGILGINIYSKNEENFNSITKEGNKLIKIILKNVEKVNTYFNGRELKGYKYSLGDSLTSGDVYINGIKIAAENFEPSKDKETDIILLADKFSIDGSNLKYEEKILITNFTVGKKQEDYCIAKDYLKGTTNATKDIIIDLDEKAAYEEDGKFIIDESNIDIVISGESKTYKLKNGINLSSDIIGKVDESPILKINASYFDYPHSENKDEEQGSLLKFKDDLLKICLKVEGINDEIEVNSVVLDLSDSTPTTVKNTKVMDLIQSKENGLDIHITNIKLHDSFYQDLEEKLTDKITIMLNPECDELVKKLSKIDETKILELDGKIQSEVESRVSVIRDSIKSLTDTVNGLEEKYHSGGNEEVDSFNLSSPASDSEESEEKEEIPSLEKTKKEILETLLGELIRIPKLSEDGNILIKVDENNRQISFIDTKGEAIKVFGSTKEEYYVLPETEEVHSIFLEEAEFKNINVIFEDMEEEVNKVNDKQKEHIPKKYKRKSSAEDFIGLIEEIDNRIKELENSDKSLDIEKLNNLISKSCDKKNTNDEELLLNIDPITNYIIDIIRNEIEVETEGRKNVAIELEKIYKKYEDTENLINEKEKNITEALDAKVDEIKLYKDDILYSIEAFDENISDNRKHFDETIEVTKKQLESEYTNISNIIDNHQTYVEEKVDLISEIANDYEERCNKEIELVIDKMDECIADFETKYSLSDEDLNNKYEEFLIKVDNKLNEEYDILTEKADNISSEIDDAKSFIDEAVNSIDGKVNYEIELCKTNLEDAMENSLKKLETDTSEFIEKALEVAEDEIKVLIENYSEFIKERDNSVDGKIEEFKNEFISKEQELSLLIDDFKNEFENVTIDTNDILNIFSSNLNTELESSMHNFKNDISNYIDEQKSWISDVKDNTLLVINETINSNTQTIMDTSDRIIENCDSFILRYDELLNNKIVDLEDSMNEFDNNVISKLDNVELLIEENRYKFESYDTTIKNINEEIKINISDQNSNINSVVSDFIETVENTIKENENYVINELEEFSKRTDSILNEFKEIHTIEIKSIVDDSINDYDLKMEDLKQDIFNFVNERINETEECQNIMEEKLIPLNFDIQEAKTRLYECEENIVDINEKVNDILSPGAIEGMISYWFDENLGPHNHSALHVNGFAGEDTITKKPLYYYDAWENDIEHRNEDPDSWDPDRYWSRDNIEINYYNPTRKRLTIDRLYPTKFEVSERIDREISNLNVDTLKNDVKDEVFNDLKDSVSENIADILSSNIEENILNAYIKNDSTALDIEKTYDSLFKHLQENKSNHSHSKYVQETTFRTHNHDNIYCKKLEFDSLKLVLNETLDKKVADISSSLLNELDYKMKNEYISSNIFNSHIEDFDKFKKSLQDHKHDNYATKLELSEKANFTHNHDGIYSPVGHTHDYQPKGNYVTKEEVENNIVMDGVYARLEDTYSKEVVYTKAEINGLMTEYHNEFIKKDEVYNNTEIDSKFEEVNTRISEVNKLPEDVYTKQEVLDLLKSSIEHMHADYMERITKLEQEIAELKGKITE